MISSALRTVHILCALVGGRGESYGTVQTFFFFTRKSPRLRTLRGRRSRSGLGKDMYYLHDTSG